MKCFLSLLLLPALALSADMNPIQKTMQMLSDLQAKIIGEGTVAHKVFSEFSEFCEDRSKELHFEIQTEQEQVASLKATIAKEIAIAGEMTTRIEELSSELATDQSDLKAATDIRTMEAAEFAATEKELSQIIDTLGRAVAIVEKEMAKAGASMLQLKNVHSLEEALKIMVDSTMLSVADASRLTALVQQQGEDADVNAPDPTVYASHSGDIVATLQNMFEKAESQLAELRSTEVKDTHNFEMMKQGLEDEIKYGEKELAEAKTNLAAAEEKRANAEGELAVTTKDLNNDIKVLADLHATCMSKANDYEDESKSRGEELNALAAAKKAIADNTSGAGSLSYSLFQKSRISTRADLANFEAVQFIRNLAKKHGSAALAQLASRMSAAMSYGTRSGEDPFIKVKGLIQDMIEKLEAEAEADASLKAYCDRENAESMEKKLAKEAEIEKLTTSIDSMSARSAKLKEEVAVLQKELGDLAKSQAEMDKVRAEEKATYESNKADMEQGIKGVKLALKVLTEYYAKDHDHGAADGAGAGIIGLLEVIESDFTKGLAEMTATETNSADEYDKQTKENEITKTTKTQDVKYKTKEFVGLDKAIAEATSDRSGVQEELDAVNEYLAELKTKCFPFPRDTYEERVARRNAEIAGLKDGLRILNGEAVLIQQSARRSLLKASRSCSLAGQGVTADITAESTPTAAVGGGTWTFKGPGQVKMTDGKNCLNTGGFDGSASVAASSGGASDAKTVSCGAPCCIEFCCGTTDCFSSR